MHIIRLDMLQKNHVLVPAWFPSCLWVSCSNAVQRQ